MDLRHYLHVLRRNWPLLLVAITMCVGVAVFHESRQPAVYESRAQVLLMPENLVEPSVATNAAARFDAVRYATAQLALLTSSRIAGPAAATLEDTTVEDVLDNTTASVDSSSTIITIQTTARQPQRAAAMADAVAAAYVQDRATVSEGKLTDALAEVEERLAALEGALSLVDDEEMTVSQLAVQQQYQLLFARQQDLQVQLSLQESTAELLEAAAVPSSPIGLGLTAKVILAVMFGGVLGLAAVYAREQLDDRVRSREEVQALTDLPVLAELPSDRASRRETHIATVDRPLDPLAEAVRSLRTSISFLGLDEPIRLLAITSAAPGEGKTMVTSNLGAACARAGLRTVVVSADLRRPALEKVFGMDRPLGLSDAFTIGNSPKSRRLLHAATHPTTEESFEAVVRRHVLPTRIENLFILPAGTPVPNPAELLSSDRMSEVLEVLERTYDMVILDTSPILSVADAAALSTKVGNVLLVASMPSTRRRTLGRLIEAVEATHARVLGIALNRASTGHISYGGYFDADADRAARGGVTPSARLRYGDAELRTSKFTDQG